MGDRQDPVMVESKKTSETALTVVQKQNLDSGGRGTSITSSGTSSTRTSSSKGQDALAIRQSSQNGLNVHSAVAPFDGPRRDSQGRYDRNVQAYSQPQAARTAHSAAPQGRRDPQSQALSRSASASNLQRQQYELQAQQHARTSNAGLHDSSALARTSSNPSHRSMSNSADRHQIERQSRQQNRTDAPQSQLAAQVS